MNRDETMLVRLFRAAQRAPVLSSEPMPENLKTRILAHWRSGGQAEEHFVLLALLFRRALIGAAVVMFLCVVWSYQGLISPPENDVALANYELREDLLP
jgi:hypothetical protein